MASILLDGYNLGLVKGTGVATYARNLSLEATRLGHDVSVVYGQAFGNKGDELLREIAFFDPDLKKPKKFQAGMQMLGHAIHSPLPHRPREVTMSGSVISRAQAAQMPECERIYNSTNLFKRAHAFIPLNVRRQPCLFGKPCHRSNLPARWHLDQHRRCLFCRSGRPRESRLDGASGSRGRTLAHDRCLRQP